ncbi:MAG: ABC transporter permease [Anaerolineae bacterium]|nr:ABC transporter permease [Anaerolineae bacterium]MCA9891403.1 ABC transporter permease [Anaerolineae bacterium]MCB9458681.1 ABC transporter permease [Anaerolineaceae bacterium]
MAGKYRQNTFFAFFRRLFKRPLPRIAFFLLVFIILAVLFGPFITRYDAITPDFAAARQPPSIDHLLGTDDIGRDILARILVGGRVSLAAAVVPLTIAISIGIPLGLIAGLMKGWVDDVIMRVLDALLSFPRIILIIAIAGVLGPNLINALVAIGIVQIAPLARLTRGLTLSTSEEEYVTVARALGASDFRIMLFHILPNILAPLIVTISLNVGGIILAEATLSFLGLGIQPPNPSWGSMVAVGNRYIQTYPWISLVPGTAIFLTVISVNLLGDGLRDAMDPYLKSRA